jgi:hypothetical protein
MSVFSKDFLFREDNLRTFDGLIPTDIVESTSLIIPSLSTLMGEWFSKGSTIASPYIISKYGDNNRLQLTGTAFKGNSAGYVNYGNNAFGVAYNSPSFFYFEAKIDATLATSQPLISKAPNASGIGFQIYLVNTGDIFIRYAVAYITNELRVHSVPTYNDSTWHRFLITYDGSTDAAGIRMYVDGSIISTSTVFDTLSGDITNALNFQISGRDGANQLMSDKIILKNVQIGSGMPTSEQRAKIFAGKLTQQELARTFWDKLENNAVGTTNYNSVNAATTGTKTSWAAANNYSGSDVLSDYRNEVGYTLSGSNCIPRNEADIGKDIAGNLLQYKGQVAYRAKFIQQKCLKGNGSTYYVEADGVSMVMNASTTLTIKINVIQCTTVSSVSKLFDCRDTTDFSGVHIYRSMTTTNLVVAINYIIGGNYRNFTYDGLLIAANEGKEWVFTINKSSMILTIDGVVQTQTSNILVGSENDFNVTAKLILFRHIPTSSYFGAYHISDVKINEAHWFPLQEGEGSSVYDVIGGLVGTINNYAAGVWALSDTCSFYPLIYGYTLSGSALIPASQTNKGFSAAGTVLTHSTSIYNPKLLEGAVVDFTGGVACPANKNLPTSFAYDAAATAYLTYSDLDSANANIKFKGHR